MIDQRAGGQAEAQHREQQHPGQAGASHDADKAMEMGEHSVKVRNVVGQGSCGNGSRAGPVHRTFRIDVSRFDRGTFEPALC